MDDAIIDIAFLPPWDAPEIKKRLLRSLEKASAMRGAVAYWTVGADFLGPLLAARLANPNGYICVDIHLPTDLDELARLASRGAEVRIYCVEIPTRSENNKKEPPYLMHAKTLLFWMSGGTAELWVGSHNWTNRALLGLNVECTLVLRLRHSSPLFSDAVIYLDKVRTLCSRLDAARLDFYKQLQRDLAEKTVPFVELEGPEAQSLQDATISVFGSDVRDLDELGTIGRDVYVSIFHELTGVQYHYEAEVLGAGQMMASNPAAGNTFFEPRRFAFRHGRKFPRLVPNQQIGTDIISNAHYFVTLHLKKLDPLLQALDPPLKTDAWLESPGGESPLLRRMDPNDVKTLFRGKVPIVRKPSESREAYAEMPDLVERRNLPEHGFIVRKILRRRV